MIVIFLNIETRVALAIKQKLIGSSVNINNKAFGEGVLLCHPPCRRLDSNYDMTDLF